MGLIQVQLIKAKVSFYYQAKIAAFLGFELEKILTWYLRKIKALILDIQLFKTL